MRRFLSRKIHLSLALGTITVVSVAASALVAYQSVGAFGINIGGRITYTFNCPTPDIRGRCAGCELCSNLLPGACGLYTEIQYLPAGGTPGQPYICVPKGYPYRGGGRFPRPGAMLKAKMLTPFLPIQVGIGL